MPLSMSFGIIVVEKIEFDKEGRGVRLSKGVEVVPFFVHIFLTFIFFFLSEFL